MKLLDLLADKVINAIDTVNNAGLTKSFAYIKFTPHINVSITVTIAIAAFMDPNEKTSFALSSIVSCFMSNPLAP
jgi:hypothetical protein